MCQLAVSKIKGYWSAVVLALVAVDTKRKATATSTKGPSGRSSQANSTTKMDFKIGPFSRFTTVTAHVHRVISLHD